VRVARMLGEGQLQLTNLQPNLARLIDLLNLSATVPNLRWDTRGHIIGPGRSTMPRVFIAGTAKTLVPGSRPAKSRISPGAAAPRRTHDCSRSSSAALRSTAASARSAAARAR
jgi:hypothetical protein